MRNKKMTGLCFLLVVSLHSVSQENLQAKLDSILQEADLLYHYEKAAWNGTDLLMENDSLKSKYAGYIAYHIDNQYFITFFDKTLSNRIAKYSFTNINPDIPFMSDTQIIPLTDMERELLEMKIQITNNLSDAKYILLPFLRQL